MQPSGAVIVDVGGVAVRLNTTDPALVDVLERRFGRFLNPSAAPAFEFDVTVVDRAPVDADGDGELRVRGGYGRWTMERGDFRAEWDVSRRRGRIWQTLNPYAIDSI